MQYFEVYMFRTLVSLVGFLSLGFVPSLAVAKTITINLDSDKAGTIVEVASVDDLNTIIHSCLTPCSVDLRKKKKKYYEITFYKSGYLLKQERLASDGSEGQISVYMRTAKPVWKNTSAFYKNNCKDASGDHPALPCVRIPPIIPSKTKRSGHCEIEFQVDEYGVIINSKIVYCTEKSFARTSLRSLRKWRYIPKVQNGKFVPSEKIHSKIHYKLQDAKGKLKPEQEKTRWYYPSE